MLRLWFKYDYVWFEYVWTRDSHANFHQVLAGGPVWKRIFVRQSMFIINNTLFIFGVSEPFYIAYSERFIFFATFWNNQGAIVKFIIAVNWRLVQNDNFERVGSFRLSHQLVPIFWYQLVPIFWSVNFICCLFFLLFQSQNDQRHIPCAYAQALKICGQLFSTLGGLQCLWITYPSLFCFCFVQSTNLKIKWCDPHTKS